ncbi:MAG: acid--CoA ligase [Candidatus Xenobiia bacterium LiM19]
MDIVSFIEDQAMIRKILTHLDLWKVPERPPPKLLFQDLDDYDIAS